MKRHNNFTFEKLLLFAIRHISFTAYHSNLPFLWNPTQIDVRLENKGIAVFLGLKSSQNINKQS
jgi:hypothetical protein